MPAGVPEARPSPKAVLTVCSLASACRVLRTGRGIPVTLSVIAAAVGARAGVRLRFVGAPGHFLTRFDVETGPAAGQQRWVDAFHGGGIMNRCGCRELRPPWIMCLAVRGIYFCFALGGRGEGSSCWWRRHVSQLR